MTQPLQQVAAPTRGDYRFGLYSVSGLVDVSDQKEFWAGVEWDTTCPDVPMSTLPQDACAAATLTLDRGAPVDDATVLRLYTGVECDPTGDRDLIAYAQEKLELSEQQSLERYAWNSAAGNAPQLSDPATTVLAGTDVTPVRLEYALGLLEQWVGDVATGGAIWAPRWTSGFLQSLQVVTVEQNSRKLGPAGTPVILASTDGAGAGPDGSQPAVGNAWLYATGPVMVRRSRVLLPDFAAALNRLTNDLFIPASRMYTVGWSCGTAAVQVVLPDLETASP